MRRFVLLAVVSCGLLSGCASQIMKSYIGKDVREVVLEYGPPTNAMDMGDGRRAFQWALQSSYTAPVQSSTTGTVTGAGNSAWVNSNTTISGGQTTHWTCLYTLFANWQDNKKAWIVSGYKTPRMMCQ